MNKSIQAIAASLFFFSGLYAQTAVTNSTGFNYSSFTPEKKIITPELQSLTDKEFQQHPEFGVLPNHAPCKDCFELLQKRDETHRYYVIEGSKGKEFYQETSYGEVNYYDGTGVLRSIDQRIKPTADAGVFKASQQPMPVTINVPQKFTSILNAGKELKVNCNVTMYIKHKDGSVTSLGEPSWNDYTAGDDGVLIHNFYPGIDLEMRSQEGAIKSNYRINKPLNLTDGWLVVHDNIALPEGLVYDYSYSDKKDNLYEGMLCINNEAGKRYFIIASPAAFDENKESNNAITLPYQTNAAGAYDMYVPIDWMNSDERSYPLVIDPYVTGSDTLQQAMITGSGYSATCFANGCQYDLDLNVPAATTITDIRYTFYYQGLGLCNIDQGAFDLTYAGCRSPATAGTWHTCTIELPGVCQSDSLDCFADMQSCIPPPQCTSYEMPFVLTFYRCISPGGGCGFSCINANTPWIMFVRGYYITVTAANTSVCQGSSVNLTAIADSGISPYTYTWYPGGLVGNPISVSPTTTTTYTVTAKDCQPLLDTLTDSAQTVVTVVVDSCTGIIESYLSNLFKVYPNPANTQLTLNSSFIHTNEEITISIMNVLGEMMQEEKRKWINEVSINIKSLPAGMYFIQLKTNDGVAAKRFVKE